MKTAIEYVTLCNECVNSIHGFDDEVVERHSGEAFGTCDDCGDDKQVATWRITKKTAEGLA